MSSIDHSSRADSTGTVLSIPATCNQPDLARSDRHSIDLSVRACFKRAASQVFLRSDMPAARMKGKHLTANGMDGTDADAGQQPDLRTRGWHRRFGQQYVALLYKNGEFTG